MGTLKPVIHESVAVVGPTACGKTRRAVQLARMLDSEIISADSRQVYRGMTIGTGKDLEEYGEIPYHLIDIMPAGSKYNLHRYLKDFNVVYDKLVGEGKIPVICGGSGMYVENALAGIRLPDVPTNIELRERLESKSLEELAEILRAYKSLHNSTDIDTKARAIRAIEIEKFYSNHPEQAADAYTGGAKPKDCVVIGLDIPREDRRRKISERLVARLNEGMVAEVENLLADGIAPDDLIYYGLEYKFVTQHLIGQLSYDEMVHGLETAIHQFAKRQMTWFRGMEKRGIHINWMSYDMSDEDFAESAMRLLTCDDR